VSLLIETEVQELPKTNSYIGMDVGLKDFAILSDGTTYKNPKFFRLLEEKLAKSTTCSFEKNEKDLLAGINNE
jgi:putative transposase